MRQSYVLIFVLFFVSVWFSLPADAAMPPACNGINNSNVGVTRALMDCLIHPTGGMVATAVNSILVKIGAALTPIFMGAGVLALIVVGLMTATGQVVHFKATSFTFLLKMGLGITFLSSLPMWYSTALQAMYDMSVTAGSITGASKLCPGAGVVWDKWDCVIDIFFSIGAKGVAAGFLAMIVLSIFSGGLAGFSFMFAAITFLFTLMQATARPMLICILSTFGFATLFMIAPLAVPTILFRNTASYFSAWIKTLLAFFIMPIAAVAFTSMLFMVFEEVMCSSKGLFSVVGSVVGGGCQNPKSIKDGMASLGTSKDENISLQQDVNKTSIQTNAEIVGEFISDTWDSFVSGVKTITDSIMKCASDPGGCISLGVIDVIQAGEKLKQLMSDLLVATVSGALTLYTTYVVMGLLPNLIVSAFHSNAASSMTSIGVPGMRTAQQQVNKARQGMEAAKGSNPFKGGGDKAGGAKAGGDKAGADKGGEDKSGGGGKS